MVWKENRENAYCEITPAILSLKEQWEKKNYIDPKLYKEYNVKRGLRDEDGRGVLTGLTRVGEIQSYSVTEGEHIIPQDGVLYYRGIDTREIVKGSVGRRFAFEETAYLLLFGELPTAAQLEDFCAQLASYRTLPTNFFRDVIMKAPPRDLMNTMQRGILTLFCYDDKPNDIGLENVLRQCLQLMSNMPVLAIYAYQAWRFSQGESLFIHKPHAELSTAENFLRMLREDRSYTELEARVLDVALVLHADNGGGNNSTFTNHVVTSSGTDTYSAIAAAMASLKGPRHGGANNKVMAMMDDVKEHVENWNDEGCVADYLTKLLNKEAFDRSGLIYRSGPCGLHQDRPPVRGVPELCGASGGGEGPGRRAEALSERGEDRQAAADGAAAQVRALHQHRLLQRLCLRDAGSSPGAVHPPLCRGPDRRLERPPDGGAVCGRQADPSPV